MVPLPTDDNPVVIVHGDCLDILPQIPDGVNNYSKGVRREQAAIRSADAEKQRPGWMVTITDPPYGCGKADWDIAYPTEWYHLAKKLSHLVCIITGSPGLPDSIKLVGSDFVDVIAARNMNGMTRGPIGFCNWLACVLACGKPVQGPNTFDFTISNKMPDHPSPKPIEYMRKLIRRVTKSANIILDPFAGSGTTGVAAILEGRKAILIEKDAGYVEVIKKRIAETLGRRTTLANGKVVGVNLFENIL